MVNILLDSFTINAKSGVSKAGIFTPGPKEVTAGRLGYLFIIVEIASSQRRAGDLIDRIIHELSSYYYHSATSNAEAALEAACQFFNDHCIEITKLNKNQLAKVSILMAALQDNQFTLANTHKVLAYLVRHNRLVNVLAGGQEQLGIVRGNKKFFAYLTSGELKPGDVVILTTTSLFDYFSNEQIKQTLQKLSPVRAVEFFKNSLLPANPRLSFASIILKIPQPLTSQISIKEPLISQDLKGESDLPIDPLSDLWGLKEKTGRILSGQTLPSWLHSLKGQLQIKKKIFPKVRNLKLSFKPSFRQFSAPTSAKSAPRDRLADNQREANRGDLTKDILELKTDTANSVKREDIVFRQIISSLLTFFKKRYEKFKSLTVRAKASLIIALFLGVVFLGSIFYVYQLRSEKVKDIDLSFKLEVVKQKIDEAEAALIYLDEEKARLLLSEAGAVLGSLSTRNHSERVAVESVRSRYDRLSQDIFRIEKIEPILLADLSSLVSGPANHFKDLVLVGDRLIVFDVNGQQIALVNKQSGNISISPYAQRLFSSFKALSLLDEDKVALLLSDNSIGIFSLKENSFSRLTDVSLTAKIDDLKTYAGRLYLLASSNNQIWRLDKISDSYSQPTPWLTESGLDISEAVSMGIDGNIYLVKNDGTLQKFFRGQQVEFISPRLGLTNEEVSKLITTRDFNKIYLLLPTARRLAILSKDGKLLKQYLFSNLSRIDNIAVDAGEVGIFILTEEKIYKAPLTL